MKAKQGEEGREWIEKKKCTKKENIYECVIRQEPHMLGCDVLGSFSHLLDPLTLLQM